MVTGTHRIGEIATGTGFTPDALRFYERLGLLPRYRRTAGAFRIYASDVVETRAVHHTRANESGYRSMRFGSFSALLTPTAKSVRICESWLPRTSPRWTPRSMSSGISRHAQELFGEISDWGIRKSLRAAIGIPRRVGS